MAFADRVPGFDDDVDPDEKEKQEKAEAAEKQAKEEAEAAEQKKQAEEEREKEEEQKKILDYLEQYNSKLLVGTTPPIKWLIEGSFRLGELGVFAAIGAAGKSMLLSALALEVIQDKNGSLYRNPLLGGKVVATGSVVIFCAEDNRDEIWRRLEQLDPGGKIRLSAPHDLYVITIPDLDGPPMHIVRTMGRELKLGQGFDFIESIVLAIPDLVLNLIDPIQPFCGADLNQSAEAVQIAFNALAHLAAKTKMSIIVSHHMRKGKDPASPEEARDSIRGSGDIVNRPRLSYAIWPAGKEDIAKVGRALGIPTPRNSVFLGAVVKANGLCNNEVQTYVRDAASGLLIDRTAGIDAQQRANAGPMFDALVQGIADAALAGRPFMRTGQAGLYERRSELPACLQYLGNEKLPRMANRLLIDGRVVLANAGGTTPKWLDLPEGPFARGEGAFEPGAPTGRAGAKKKPEASAPTGRAGRRPGAKRKPAAGGRRQRAKKEPT